MFPLKHLARKGLINNIFIFYDAPQSWSRDQRINRVTVPIIEYPMATTRAIEKIWEL